MRIPSINLVGGELFYQGWGTPKDTENALLLSVRVYTALSQQGPIKLEITQISVALESTSSPSDGIVMKMTLDIKPFWRYEIGTHQVSITVLHWQDQSNLDIVVSEVSKEILKQLRDWAEKIHQGAREFQDDLSELFKDIISKSDNPGTT
jgi:hypothetical protein